MERLVEIGNVRNWKNCYVKFSLYENNTLKGDLYSEDGKLLMKISDIGPANPAGLVMYVPNIEAASRNAVVTKLMEHDLIYGYVSTKDGCAICAVSDTIVDAVQMPSRGMRIARAVAAAM